MTQTEVKNTTNQLNQLLADEEIARPILEHILDPVFIVNKKSDPVFMNDSCRILFSSNYNIKKIKDFCREFKKGDSARSVNFKVSGKSINFNVLPVWRKGMLEGAIWIGRLKCIEDIYSIIQDTRSKKNDQKIGIRFKPKRLLPPTMQQIAGNNYYFVKTLHKAAAAAQTDSTVIIYGESGVGKQALAEAIHKTSMRAKGPFIEVNCAAIPENLLESELFGYDPYSFTGASKQGKMGKFEAANGGTIFLDEIGEMSLNMQAKLLRVLQFKEFEKVGGTAVSVNVRVIAATNKNIEKMVQQGLFREDLFYRLSVIPIVIKPLRDRKEDLDNLVDRFMELFAEKYEIEAMRLSTEVVSLLYNYHWPGNIRELENLLEHAFISAKFEGVDEIMMEHLPDYFMDIMQPKTDCLKNTSTQTLSEMIKHVETEYILNALRSTGFNKNEAIKKLGISRGSFYSKIKDYEIVKEQL
ncbi:MAG: sigma 54-interacting transcriptional regulator [Dethiobacter sp.]|jgi:transcriptional regulator with PAS, ATPase and Fis domain|nr:sigma 54-interacting transcriptional regulator [Dethiobacter sp.]